MPPSPLKQRHLCVASRVHRLLSSVLERKTSREPGLMTVVECLPPLLAVIGGFLAESPCDIVAFFYTSSRTILHQADFAMNTLWQDMFSLRWRAFYDAYRFEQTEEPWNEIYRETLCGRREFMLEVFDRQKKDGFAMSAMPARVHFDCQEGSHVAWYLSASEVPPELIPAEEAHRLRFCPASVRDPLWRSSSDAPAAVSDLPQERLWSAFTERARWCVRRRSPSQDLSRENDGYPYSVLTGVDGLKVGGAVELQWKMQDHSPFGWWYGHLEDLCCDQDGNAATATITFPHFHPTSQWYRLAVRFGDGEIRECLLGGKSGGLRPVPDGEKSQWMRHFPANLIQV